MSHDLENWLRYYQELGFTHLYRRTPKQDSLPKTIEPEKIAAPAASESRSRTATPGAGRNLIIPQSASVSQTAGPISTGAADLFTVAAPRETLDDVLKDLGSDCRRCKLWKGRKSIVFGSGNPNAKLVFVGEGPGADEDEQGLPFVGRAGQLLTEMIEKGLKIPRPEVYICNIVKCRPPGNRKPEKDEVAACRQFVERQLDAIRPRVVCALGATAAETLLETRESMGRLRGRWFEFHGHPLMVTFHPAYLLRDPSKKRETWTDLKTIMAALQEP